LDTLGDDYRLEVAHVELRLALETELPEYPFLRKCQLLVACLWVSLYGYAISASVMAGKSGGWDVGRWGKWGQRLGYIAKQGMEDGEARAAITEALVGLGSVEKDGEDEANVG
jgi:hypothetical protein